MKKKKKKSPPPHRVLLDISKFSFIFIDYGLFLASIFRTHNIFFPFLPILRLFTPLLHYIPQRDDARRRLIRIYHPFLTHYLTTLVSGIPMIPRIPLCTMNPVDLLCPPTPNLIIIHHPSSLIPSVFIF